MKETTTPSWLKGSLPNWLIVGLLTFSVWGVNEAYQDFKKTIGEAVKEIRMQDKRITVLEEWRMFHREGRN